MPTQRRPKEWAGKGYRNAKFPLLAVARPLLRLPGAEYSAISKWKEKNKTGPRRKGAEKSFLASVGSGEFKVAKWLEQEATGQTTSS